MNAMERLPLIAIETSKEMKNSMDKFEKEFNDKDESKKQKR